MFSRRWLMASQTSSRRAHSVTSLPASASTSENAVPHDPAPNTATLLMPAAHWSLRLRCGLPVWRTPALRGSNRSAGAVSPRSSATSAVSAAMIRSVASLIDLRACAAGRRRSSRSTGSPDLHA